VGGGVGTNEDGQLKSFEEQFDWQLDHSVSPPRFVPGIAGSRSGYRAITSEAVGSKEALDVNVAESVAAGFNIAGYDYIALTYVAGGSDGAGEIETATFKTGGSGGTTVATLTLTYNTDDKLATVTKT
jgi:hypothetical protein